jgi:hypothetical protein
MCFARITFAWLVLLSVGCDSKTPGSEDGIDKAPVIEVPVVVEPDPVAEDLPSNSTVDDILPAELQGFWTPWHGDFDGMVERRVVRVLTT